MTKIEAKFIRAIHTFEGGTFPKRIATSLLASGHIVLQPNVTMNENSIFANANEYSLTEKGRAA